MGLEHEIVARLEAGGVWRFGRCEVVMDPSTRNLVVFYLADDDGGDDGGRTTRKGNRKTPRRASTCARLRADTYERPSAGRYPRVLKRA
jgi:hypothetical protein